MSEDRIVISDVEALDPSCVYRLDSRASSLTLLSSQEAGTPPYADIHEARYRVLILSRRLWPSNLVQQGNGTKLV